jgi:integrase
MLALVREHDADQTLLERDAEERRRRGVTFRELANEYLEWLEHVKGAKPSTLRDHRFLLAEPGQAYRRGNGASRGLVMATVGGRPAREMTTREIEDLLRSVSSRGVAPRTVNKVRQLICAIFNYGMRPSTYGLPTNPAADADRRREPERGPLAFYSPEQVEQLARSLAEGGHRDASRPALSPAEIEACGREEVQDSELVRLAAYSGLRRREIVALRWGDVDFAGRKIIVRRSLSGETELRSTKSRRAREVPLAGQAAVGSSGSVAGRSSPRPMTTSSRIASVVVWIRQPSAVASSARVTLPAWSLCDSTISDIRTDRFSLREGSIL